ncbi:MAG TPA: hypothetical protein VFK16_07085, partial [Gemmatimonadaceae bacterium]|nr:hypothetical protein [Gemmatimonadaceae bacterium]
MKTLRWVHTLGACIALALAPAALSAQVTTGTISGVVSAPQGGMEGAQVTVRQPATGFTRTVTAQA